MVIIKRIWKVWTSGGAVFERSKKATKLSGGGHHHKADHSQEEGEHQQHLRAVGHLGEDDGHLNERRQQSKQGTGGGVVESQQQIYVVQAAQTANDHCKK